MLIALSLLTMLPLQPGEPVYPSRSHGFAASILAAVIALGVLALVMVFVSSKPRNRRR